VYLENTMTLEKAIKEKNKLGETTEITGVTYQVIIAPLRKKRFRRFHKHLQWRGTK
jgi:hypothetical protein